jgi:transposase InsO family protein
MRSSSRRSPALELRSRIAELAAMKRRYGYRRIQVLLRREGWSVNHKRTYRLYREQGLAVRKRKRKRIGVAERLPLPIADGTERELVDGLRGRWADRRPQASGARDRGTTTAANASRSRSTLRFRERAL